MFSWWGHRRNRDRERTNIYVVSTVHRNASGDTLNVERSMDRSNHSAFESWRTNSVRNEYILERSVNRFGPVGGSVPCTGVAVTRGTKLVAAVVPAYVRDKKWQGRGGGVDKCIYICTTGLLAARNVFGRPPVTVSSPGTVYLFVASAGAVWMDGWAGRTER